MARTRKPKDYFNRELSWLEFNQRILDLASDSTTPLLERLRFLSITGSNLDEFFMVRVGGLQTLASQGVTKRDAAGMSPKGQLRAIAERTHAMAAGQYECLARLEDELARNGIRRVRPGAVTDEQRRHCREVFEREVLPVLTPVGIDEDADPMPLLMNRMLYLGVRLRTSVQNREALRVAVLPLGKILGRIFALPAERSRHEYIMLEDLVSMFATYFFPGETVAECAAFRITRNADMGVREDLAADLLAQMEEVLDARKRSECIRLELDGQAPAGFEAFLVRMLGVDPAFVFRQAGMIDLVPLSGLCNLPGHQSLLYESWQPQLPPSLAPTNPMFDILARGDVLLYQPFDSFEPVVRFIQEAAADPDVIAIKQVLYRTSRRSPITAALMDAAQKGKYVTVIIELKARFDEARNIEWAQELEDAGVQVIYGVKGLKTHAKICLVVRREPGGLKRYMHFGTGNYNESTARLYTDVSYLTTDEDLGGDASAFLNAVTGFSQPQQYVKIEAAPTGLRDRILELIRGETEHARQGRDAFIRAKMNSLVDQRTIQALYDASRAGVRVELNVRGICCLRPGVPGLSDTIRVISIVDRCLEHSRIFCFGGGGDVKVFISSADWMPRNFDRRVELLVPVEQAAARDRLIHIVTTCLADTVNAWELGPDGAYRRRGSAGRRNAIRSQERLYQEVVAQTDTARKAKPTMFEPHRPARAKT